MTRLTLTVVLLILVSGMILAQQTPTTTITPSQMSGTPIPAGTIFVVLPSGLVAQAELGPGLSLQLPATGRPILTVTVPSVTLPAEIVGERPTATSNLVFTLANDPKAGTLKVFRNGMRQFSPGDYSISGRTLTFVSSYSADPAPTVVCDYERLPVP